MPQQSSHLAVKSHSEQLNQVVATKLARAVYAGFEAMFAEFLNITLGAQSRFEQRQWHQVQGAMKSRLQVYEGQVKKVSQAVKIIAYSEVDDPALWLLAKQIYAEMVQSHENQPIAHTFLTQPSVQFGTHEKFAMCTCFCPKRAINWGQDPLIHWLAAFPCKMALKVRLVA